MVQLSNLIRYCDELLGSARFRDYSPNGLQVEGRAEVRRLVGGVTASAALLERALAVGADAVLVHHGYFWKGEPAAVTGIKRRRLKLLLERDVSLIAYHLPLDAHPTLGNNAQLGADLELEAEGAIDAGGVPGLLMYGRPPEPLSAAAFAARIASALGRQPLHVTAGEEDVRRVAWCTGAAQRFIGEAAALGVDAYVSGEISEPTAHEAREYGLHYFAAGHHATERGGVRALGAHLAERFDLEHSFVDVPNPA